MRPGKVGLGGRGQRDGVFCRADHLLIVVQLLDELGIEFTAQLLAEKGVGRRGSSHGDDDHAEDEPEGQPESQSAALGERKR